MLIVYNQLQGVMINMQVTLRLVNGRIGDRVAQELFNEDGGVTKDFLVSNSLIVIGSSTRADIKLYDPRLNPTHLALAINGNKVSFRDLSTETGTKINGEFTRDGEGELKSGDKIQIGEYTRFQVLIEPDLEKQPARPFPEPADSLTSLEPLRVCCDDYGDWPLLE